MSTMPTIIQVSGPWGFALLILTGVVLFLSIRAGVTAAGGVSDAGPLLRNQANVILFWGSASAVIGFLGQWHGAYLALSVILRASELSPYVVAEGFVISFVPALFGLGIFVFSALVWFLLRVLSPGPFTRKRREVQHV